MEGILRPNASASQAGRLCSPAADGKDDTVQQIYKKLQSAGLLNHRGTEFSIFKAVLKATSEQVQKTSPMDQLIAYEAKKAFKIVLARFENTGELKKGELFSRPAKKANVYFLIQIFASEEVCAMLDLEKEIRKEDTYSTQDVLSFFESVHKNLPKSIDITRQAFPCFFKIIYMIQKALPTIEEQKRLYQKFRVKQSFM